jgi:hypothetical protein
MEIQRPVKEGGESDWLRRYSEEGVDGLKGRLRLQYPAPVVPQGITLDTSA